METIDPIAELSRAVQAAGSQRRWAAQNGLSAPYVSDVLAGRRDPGAAVLSALGLERVVSYRRIGQAPIAPAAEYVSEADPSPRICRATDKVTNADL
jgi:DNA-binding transcriptional regulator YdaS (Cro superfamily)